MFVDKGLASNGMLYFIMKKPKGRIVFSPFILLTVFLFNCSKNHYKQLNAEFFRESDSTYKFKDYVFQGELMPDGAPIGKGKLIYNNGIVAEGNFTNGFLDDNNGINNIRLHVILRIKVHSQYHTFYAVCTDLVA